MSRRRARHFSALGPSAACGHTASVVLCVAADVSLTAVQSHYPALAWIEGYVPGGYQGLPIGCLRVFGPCYVCRCRATDAAISAGFHTEDFR